MNNKIVVIVNGKPRSGKDTFCKIVTNKCEENNIYCDTWSTIDFEKEILEDYIKDYDHNSDIDRSFLSDFKQLLNEYYDLTYTHFTSLMEFYDGVFLIHSREWPEIQRFKNYCEKNNIKFITIFLTSKNEKNEFTNYSDKFCDDRINLYDYKYKNDGTIEEMEKYAEQFCKSELF